MRNWHQRLANTTYTPAVWVSILLFQARQPQPDQELILVDALALLELQATAVQDRLGVTGRLVHTVEDELLGSLETNGLVEVRGHRQVCLIALVLAVNDLGR